MIKVRTFLAAGAAVGASALLVVACSGAGDSGGSNFGGNGSGNAGTGGGSGGTGGSGAGGGFAGSDGGNLLDVSTNSDSALNSDSACATTKAAGEQQPVDIFIMLDQSGSMQGAKWNSVVAGISAFVDDPATAGMWVGMQYFAIPAGGGGTCPALCDSPANNTACAACGGLCMFGICAGSGGSDSCTVADYAKAEIPIAELPGNAGAIKASLQAHGPTTGTPTGPALQGAINFAQGWHSQNLDHKTVVLLATDGDPQECNPQDKDGIANIAAQGHAAGIDTYVIGMQGATMAWLDSWAAAGGTGTAYDASDPAKFVQQMNAIRGTAMTCTYTVPTTDAGTINYQSVKVTATINGAEQIIPPVSSSNDCGSGDGWYYDGNNPPKTITMCPHTCDTLKNSQGTSGVQLDLGCLSQLH